jgi:hypothetical protein
MIIWNFCRVKSSVYAEVSENILSPSPGLKVGLLGIGAYYIGLEDGKAEGEGH